MPGSPTSRRTYLRRVGATALALGVAGAGCLGGRSGSSTVEMDAFSFVPDSLTVSEGTTVRWENTSDIPHTVTAYGMLIPEGATYFASGGFDSERAARNDVPRGVLRAGGTYEHTFEVPGAYDYFCIPHESSGMRGTVRVTEP